MAENKGAKFGIGLLIGTIVGGVAAFFLSPKSGKENREMVMKKMKEMQKFIDDQDIDEQVKKVFGEVNDKTKKLYKQLQKQTKTKMKDLNEALEDLDVDKYKKQVADIIEDLKKEDMAEDMIVKARKYLMTFADRVSDTVKETVDELMPDKKPAKK